MLGAPGFPSHQPRDNETSSVPARPKVPEILKSIVSSASAHDWVVQQAAHIQRCEIAMRAAKSLCEYRAKADRRYELFNAEQRRRRNQIERTPTDAIALPRLTYPPIEHFDAGAWAAEIVGAAPSGRPSVELVRLDPRDLFGAIPDDVPVDFGIAFTRRRRPSDREAPIKVPEFRYRAFRAIEAAMGSIYHGKAKAAHAATALAILVSKALKEPLPSGLELAVVAVAAGVDDPLTNATEDTLAHRGSAWAKRKRSHGTLRELEDGELLLRRARNIKLRKKTLRRRSHSSNS